MPNPEASNDIRFISLEGRLATLETQAGFSASRTDRSEGKIDALSERVTRLEERISHLPTKDWMVKITLGALAFFAAITVFQSKIQQLFTSTVTH